MTLLHVQQRSGNGREYAKKGREVGAEWLFSFNTGIECGLRSKAGWIGEMGNTLLG